MLGFGKKDDLGGIIQTSNTTSEEEIKEIVKKVKKQVIKSKVQSTGEIIGIVKETQGRNEWLRITVICPLKTSQNLKIAPITLIQ